MTRAAATRAFALRIAFAMLLAAASAAQTTWTGVASTDWGTAGNWTAGVPTSAVDAIIAPAANNPTTSGVGGAACNALTVQAGAVLNVAAGFPLSVSGSVSVASTATVNGGLVQLVGSGTIATGTSSLPNVSIAATGSYSLSGTSLAVNGTLTNNAGTLAAGTTNLSVFDDFTTTGGSINLGSGTTTFSKSVIVNGPLTGAGMMVLDGEGTLNVSSGATLPNVQVSSTGSGMTLGGTSLALGGDLALLSGTLTVASTNTTTVAGAALFSGGTLSGSGGAILDLNGSVAFSGTASTAPPLIRCAGSWSANAAFAPTSQQVILDGSAPQTISGTGARFNELTVAAGASVTTAVNVLLAGDVTVNGQLSTTASFDFDGDVDIGSGGSLNLGSGSNSFSRSVTANGPLTGAGLVILDGEGTINLDAGSGLPDVQVSATGAGVTFGGTALAIAGTLDQLSGTLNVAATNTTTVGDAATFSGGTLAGSGTLDCNDAVAFAGTASSTPPLIRVEGNWTGHVSFDPTSSTVIFDGTTPVTITGTGIRFYNLVIAAGANVTMIQDTNIQNDLSVSGQYTAVGLFEVDGDCAVNAGGSLDMGGGDQTFSGDLTVNGPITASGGKLILDGTGTITDPGGFTLPGLSILTAGTVTFSGASIPTIGLRLTSGTLSIANGNTTTVTGLASFTGGTLALASGSGVLDVNGDVSFTGGTATTPPEIRCSNSWTAGAAFDPTSNTVVFDGTGAQNVTGANFFNVTVENASLISNLASLAIDNNLTLNGTISTATPLNVVNNLAVGGSLAMNAGGTLAVGGALAVTGTLTSSSTVDVNGTATVGALGLLDLGAGTHNFGGNFTVTGALAGSGTVVFDIAGGNQTVSLVPTASLPNVQIAGAPLNNTQISGLVKVASNLTQVSGNLYALSGSTLQVAGNASFQGGTLDTNPNTAGLIDVNGTVVFSGTTQSLVMPNISCAGNWTSNAVFVPTSGTVLFDAAGPQTVSSTSGVFSGVSVASGSTTCTTDSLTLGASLLVDGTFSCTGTLAVNGATTVNGTFSTTSACGPMPGEGTLDANADFTVGSSATLNLGSGTHTFAGSLSVAGPINATGTLVLDGARPVGNPAIVSSSGLGLLPSVRVQSTGFTRLAQSEIQGSLQLVTGDLASGSGSPTTYAHVTGSATFQGGTLSNNGTGLDIDGSVSFSGTSCFNNPRIRCGGNWTSNAAFDPIGEYVILDGSGPQALVHGGGNFSFLQIDPTSITTTTSALNIRNRIWIDGSIATSATLHLGGDLALINGTLSTTSTIDADSSFLLGGSAVANLGNATHTFSGGLNVYGTINGNPTLVLDNPSLLVPEELTAPAPVVLPNITIVGPGQVYPSGSLTIGGNLAITGGSLRFNSGTTLRVLGNATLTGGTAFDSTGAGNPTVFDVDGNLSFAGTSCNQPPPTIRCGGNWTANALFNASNWPSTLELDGTSPTTISVGSGTPRFWVVTLKNAMRQAASDLTLDLRVLTIEATSGLDIGARRVALKAQTQVDTNISHGLISVSAGGELALAPTTSLAVSPTGTLRVIGAPGTPARVAGDGGSGYGLTVNGTLQARNYLFRDMGPGGIGVSLSAVIAPAPDDLRGGTFDFGSAVAGASLLGIQRPAVSDFRYVTFLNSGGGTTFNVSCTGGANISFSNWSGAFGGSAFENDPGNRVTWNGAQQTQLLSFTAAGGAGFVALAWQTSTETDIDRFVLERATSAGGPYATVAEVVPGASPYAYPDSPLTPAQPYFYRLQERLTHGATNLLGSSSATPAPANAIFVKADATGAGTGAIWVDAFTSLQDGLAAANAGSQVWVAAGIYQPASPGGSRSATFQLEDDVAVYGGFAGVETELALRDPTANVTVLSGDLNGDDQPGFVNDGENSYHVVTGSGTNVTAILDGFTIRAGNANGAGADQNGAGLQVDAGRPTVRQCSFLSSRALANGGGLACSTSSSPLVERTVFGGNSAAAGGGAHVKASDPAFVRCRFEDNAAVSGAGCASSSGSILDLVVCAFRGNDATGDGGGIHDDGGSATMVDVLLTGNTAARGGGVFTRAATSFNLGDSTIASNTASASGGGVYVDSGSLGLVNSILWANGDAGGMDESAQVDTGGGTVTVNHCVVQGLTGGLGGTGNVGADPLLLHPAGVDEVLGTLDDDLRLAAGSSAVDAGRNSSVVADAYDLDGDANTAEPTPQDALGHARFLDDPAATDTGSGTPPIVDMGGIERETDCNGNSVPDAQDITASTSQDCNGNGVPDECDIEDGFSLDADGNGVPDDCPPGPLFCFPGQGGVSACGCGNPPLLGDVGCNNSANTGGGHLTASGAAALAQAVDTVVLRTSSMMPTSSAIYLQGSAPVAAGAPFGDGMRCAGGSLKRLGLKVSSGGGSQYPGAGDLSVSAKSAALGEPIAPGTTRYYQTYYRDPPAGFGCASPATFNITNGIVITW